MNQNVEETTRRQTIYIILEEVSEIRMLIDEIGCGKCCEPGNERMIAENIRWYIDHAGSKELVEMGTRGRSFLENHLTKNISVRKYMKAILEL